jgi:hypothetical protein
MYRFSQMHCVGPQPKVQRFDENLRELRLLCKRSRVRITRNIEFELLRMDGSSC